jgi:Leucine-rich repeat (LRR) protein
LPDNLPSTLIELYCSQNQLTSLPDNLPLSLQELDCGHNKLTSLPDLPLSLQYFGHYDNPQLEIKYPALFNNDTSLQRVADKIKYINETNSKTRTTERTKQINQADILLELYMKRRMHPTRIQVVVGDDKEADIDALMTTYTESL